MKVNSLAKKTAIAAAIAFASGSVFAGELKVDNPSVFANEIFGNLSESTTVRMPAVRFEADVSGQVVNGVAGQTSAANDTIKLTLEGNAIFGENYQDPNIWAQQGISVKIGATALTAADVLDVTGGTANDNQITITLADAVGAETLDNITLEGFKVKNLKETLERVGEGGTRNHKVTVEVRAVDAGLFENTPAVPAFYSINGVAVDAKPTDYTTNLGRAWLQAGDDYKSFTAPAGGQAEKDDLTSRNRILDLGQYSFARGELTLAGNAFAAGKETGALFDFTGADTIEFTLTSDQPLSSYTSLRLTTATCATVDNTNSIEFNADALSQTKEWESHNFNLDAGANLRLCAIAPALDAQNRSVMPEASFSLAANVTYFNTRYTNSKGEADFGRVLRNVAGCQLSLFNLPNPNAQDKAFIRFTNTSMGNEGMTGPVYATVWSQDGVLLDEEVVVVDSLAPHATVVLHTDASNAGGVNLADKLAGFAESNGRSRIVLEGEFTNCEALGMIRSPEGGLTNMTSTVYSGSQNGTSNTRN